MMESLRNFLTGPRLFIVVAACALPFVFLGTSSLSDTTGNSLGSINGENVTQADFQVATNLAIQKYKDIYGESFELSELSDEIQLEIIKQELIIQKTLLANARSMGFVNDHTRTLAKKNIIANNAFWVDGTFNEDIFEAQANANGFTKEEYIEQISLLLATDQFRSAIGTSSFALEKESRDLASILEQTINLNFIKVDSSELSQSITNTEEELLEYYKNNELKFFSDESRSFSYFILNSKDYEDLVKVPDNYIKSSYENYRRRRREVRCCGTGRNDFGRRFFAVNSSQRRRLTRFLPIPQLGERLNWLGRVHVESLGRERHQPVSRRCNRSIRHVVVVDL